MGDATVSLVGPRADAFGLAGASSRGSDVFISAQKEMFVLVHIVIILVSMYCAS